MFNRRPGCAGHEGLVGLLDVHGLWRRKCCVVDRTIALSHYRTTNGGFLLRPTGIGSSLSDGDSEILVRENDKVWMVTAYYGKAKLKGLQPQQNGVMLSKGEKVSRRRVLRCLYRSKQGDVRGGRSAD